MPKLSDNKNITKRLRLNQTEWQTIQTQMQEKNLNFSQLVLNSILTQNSQAHINFKSFTTPRAIYQFISFLNIKCDNSFFVSSSLSLKRLIKAFLSVVTIGFSHSMWAKILNLFVFAKPNDKPPAPLNKSIQLYLFIQTLNAIMVS